MKLMRLGKVLQTLCAGPGGAVVELRDFPGGAEAFEDCAKFCYGVAVTIGAHNAVPVRCAATRLGMAEAAGRGNLAAKLDAFLDSCLLRRWKDALAVLRSTAGRCAAACEELGLTSRCVHAVADLIAEGSSSPWWASDVSELGVDLFWRVMAAVKAAGTVRGRDVGDALKAYARWWLPNAATSGCLAEQTDGGAGGVEPIAENHRLVVEKIVSLLPEEKDAVSCSFLLKLLKAGSILGASPSSMAELTRRVALQFEDATVSDLLIPSSARASSATQMLYEVDAVVAILDEFALRQAAGIAEGSPASAGTHRRSRSAESVEFDGARRRSTSPPLSHRAMVRVGKLIDGFLIEVAKDANLQVDKLIAVAEAVPDCARPEHDDLYRAIDAYLRVHPDMDKSSRKRLCRVLNCRKLSETASMHAAQNDLLPLRLVVQVLFFENSRAAALSGLGANRVADMVGGVKALRAKPRREGDNGQQRFRGLAGVPADDEWSVEALKRSASRIKTLRMKLEEEEEEEEEDDADDDAFVHRARAGLARSASWRARAFCAIPFPARRPNRMLSRLWPPR